MNMCRTRHRGFDTPRFDREFEQLEEKCDKPHDKLVERKSNPIPKMKQNTSYDRSRFSVYERES